MSYYKNPMDDIDVGDYVVLEIITSGEYTYQVSGTVRIFDGVKAVGRSGVGDGKIIEHRPRPLPTAFGSHIRYPESGLELVKTTGDVWRGDDGSMRKAVGLPSGWVLIRNAGEDSK